MQKNYITYWKDIFRRLYASEKHQDMQMTTKDASEER